MESLKFSFSLLSRSHYDICARFNFSLIKQLIHTGIQMTPNNRVLEERRGEEGTDQVTEKKKKKKKRNTRSLAQRCVRIYMTRHTHTCERTLTHVWNATRRHNTATATRGAAGRLARRGSWRHSVGSPGTLLSRSYEAHRIYDLPSSFSRSLAPRRRHGILSNYIFVASRFKFLEITDFRNKPVIPSLLSYLML